MRIVTEESPAPCIRIIDGHEVHCSHDKRKLLGCGFVDFEGKGALREHGSQHAPYNRTCPQYYARIPAVMSCYDYIDDYRRGALGNVLDLPNPLWQALGILDVELKQQERVNEERISHG